MVDEPRSEGNAPAVPSVVYAEASPRSVGGSSPFETAQLITSESVPEYYSEPQTLRSASERLRAEGFEVLRVGQATVTIAAPAEVYERVFRTSIVAEEREAVKHYGRVTNATFLECPDTAIPGLIDPADSPLADVLDGVAINERVYPMASAAPPPKAYLHLNVPADVSLGLNADRAHREGLTGRDVTVVMVDSGWYRHPFFVERGYRATPVELGPAATDPDHDEDGHGTGESANVFAVAPDVTFTMVKYRSVNSVGAFNAAVALSPDVISCSWGTSKRNPPLSAADQALAAAIASAVRQGIVVVFAAGNGHWGFPGQHPDVISAGGAYMHPDGTVEASSYASGFRSQLYPGRDVPDVCGLVGHQPQARYIMLPVEPNRKSDVESSGGTHPSGDETSDNDGWAAFSGTSAAAPQLAGVCALMKQASAKLSPPEASEILKQTARDVTSGRCNEVFPPDEPEGVAGHPAGPGTDVATGHGLTDAFRAVKVAQSFGA
jgi:subtilisin family serine protease